MNNHKILKIQDVKALTSLSTSSIYRLISQGKFPKQIKLSERSSGWLEIEVLDFITTKIELRD